MNDQDGFLKEAEADGYRDEIDKRLEALLRLNQKHKEELERHQLMLYGERLERAAKLYPEFLKLKEEGKI